MKAIVDVSRRRLIQKLLLGTVLVPIVGAPLTVVAADAPLVTGDDPTAKALKYVDDVSKATGAKPGSKCANCQLFQGKADDAQGPCLLFPGKSVKSSGWCSSWTAKPT
jgi:hypothetical protein